MAHTAVSVLNLAHEFLLMDKGERRIVEKIENTNRQLQKGICMIC